MPNLVGIWSPNVPEESIRLTLAQQLHRVRVPNIRYEEYVDIHPGFAVALQDHGILENGIQPARTQDRRVSLMLDGELYNADELKKQFRHQLPQHDISPPELCLRLITQLGTDVVNLFNGLFCLVLYERDTQRLTLISDHFGARPLYYVQRPKALIFGTELKALAVADPEPRRIDEISTLEYFCYGYHVSGRTWLQGYLRLPPATILTVDPHGVRTHTYWTYKYDESAPPLDQPTYFTVYAILLDRAVERCMKGRHRIGIFLSGGYDSRSVAACIRKHHLPVPAFTFGYPHSRDVRYAAMLAQRLGLDHHPLTDREPYLYRHCRSIVWRTEGMSPFADVTSIRYHPIMKQKIDIILTGFLSEFSGSHTWPQLLLARSRTAATKAIFQRMVETGLPIKRKVFNSPFFKNAFEALRNRFLQSFETIQNDHPLNVADCWNFVHFQPLSTWHSPSVDRHLFEMRAPHTDFDLAQFLLTIPPYSRLEQRVYKKMIAYSFPKIRSVPCTNSGLPINPNFVQEYVTMAVRYLGRKAATHFRSLFDMQQPLGREPRHLADDFRAEPELIHNVLRPLLRGGIFPSHMFNYSGIENLINEHYQKNQDHAAILSRLISWGLAVKFFLYDDLAEVPSDIYSPGSPP